MSCEGNKLTCDLLAKGEKAQDAIIRGIQNVEDNPDFHSVGYGGLPNKEGRCQFDAGYMDGKTMHFGAVAGMSGFRSPVAVAKSLVDRPANNFLVGEGAEQYASEHGFEQRVMETEEALARYELKKEELAKLESYDGHDTVCFVVKQDDQMIVATSTSGLFMKDKGRMGDSPVPGSGYYVDCQIGGAAATGLGEEIMKGVLSYEIVRLMEEGVSVQEAAQKAVNNLDAKLKERNGSCDSISVIALDKDGNYGVGTNLLFPFVYGSETSPTALYEAEPDGEKLIIRKVEEVA